jgi:hypothetical protein
MSEYIITEEEINEIDNGELKSYRKFVLNRVRSRPYTNDLIKTIQMPVMLAVDFIGGAVITTSTPEETLAKMEDAHNQYKNYVERMGIDDER